MIRREFLKSSGALIVTFGAAFYVSIYYHEPIAALIGSYVTGTSPFLLSALTYVGTFLGVYLVLYTITVLLERALRVSKLKAFGIAPPERTVSRVRHLFATPRVACPRCDSLQTERVSEFGSTPCKAHYRCRNCAEPFDHFKCI